MKEVRRQAGRAGQADFEKNVTLRHRVIQNTNYVHIQKMQRKRENGSASNLLR